MAESGRQKDTPSRIIRRETGRPVQKPVAPTLGDREASLVCARHPRSLRHAVVPGVGVRPPLAGLATHLLSGT